MRSELATPAGAIQFREFRVTPSFPAKTVPEFIAYAKANPS